MFVPDYMGSNLVLRTCSVTSALAENKNDNHTYLGMLEGLNKSFMKASQKVE